MHPCLQQQITNRCQGRTHLKLPHPEVRASPQKAHPQFCMHWEPLQLAGRLRGKLKSPCLTAAAALFSPSLLISAKSWAPAGGALDAAGSPTSRRKPVRLYPSLRAAASATSLEACACRQSAKQALYETIAGPVICPLMGFESHEVWPSSCWCKWPLHLSCRHASASPKCRCAAFKLPPQRGHC